MPARNNQKLQKVAWRHPHPGRSAPPLPRTMNVRRRAGEPPPPTATAHPRRAHSLARSDRTHPTLPRSTRMNASTLESQHIAGSFFLSYAMQCSCSCSLRGAQKTWAWRQKIPFGASFCEMLAHFGATSPEAHCIKLGRRVSEQPLRVPRRQLARRHLRPVQLSAKNSRPQPNNPLTTFPSRPRYHLSQVSIHHLVNLLYLLFSVSLLYIDYRKYTEREGVPVALNPWAPFREVCGAARDEQALLCVERARRAPRFPISFPAVREPPSVRASVRRLDWSVATKIITLKIAQPPIPPTWNGRRREEAPRDTQAK